MFASVPFGTPSRPSPSADHRGRRRRGPRNGATDGRQQRSAETITFFVRHLGVICAPLTGERLDELEIPLMVRDNTGVAPHGVHLLGRLRPRHLDGHLGRGPGRDHQALIDPATRPRTSPAPATSSRCGTPGGVLNRRA